MSSYKADIQYMTSYFIVISMLIKKQKKGAFITPVNPFSENHRYEIKSQVLISTGYGVSCFIQRSDMYDLDFVIESCSVIMFRSYESSKAFRIKGYGYFLV